MFPWIGLIYTLLVTEYVPFKISYFFAHLVHIYANFDSLTILNSFI